MSQLDLFIEYLNSVNEGNIALTTKDYTKICTIRDQVTDLAKQFTTSFQTFNEPAVIKTSAIPNYVAAEENHDDLALEFPEELQEYTVLQYEEFVNEMIVKDGKHWLVKDKKGKKVLGTHPSRKKALAQLRAIEISKAGH